MCHSVVILEQHVGGLFAGPASIFVCLVFEVINIHCCGYGFSSIPDRRSVISNAGGWGPEVPHRYYSPSSYGMGTCPPAPQAIDNPRTRNT